MGRSKFACEREVSLLRILLILLIAAHGGYLWAKGNQAVYEDPFDQAAGGASLTRASQEAVLFANPAMMPYGKKFLRWCGTQFSVLAGRDSIEEAKKLTGKRSEEDEGQEEDKNADFADQVFKKPLHFGATSTVSFITNNMGIGTFVRFEPDIAGKEFDETGLPSIRARAEVYGGAVIGAAVLLRPWLSVGVTGKYLYKSEPDITLSLADQGKIQSFRDDPQALRRENELGQGMGTDAGALIFLQGYNLDYRFALKIDDIGDTQFSKEQDSFKQIIHVGTGVTLHNAIDSLHLSLDFRDVAGVYNSSLPMRLYTGAKLIVRNYVGIAAGLYQGYPTYGVKLDLLLVKLGFTYFGREMGRYAGDDGRNIYVVSLGFGL